MRVECSICHGSKIKDGIFYYTETCDLCQFRQLEKTIPTPKNPGIDSLKKIIEANGDCSDMDCGKCFFYKISHHNFCNGSHDTLEIAQAIIGFVEQNEATVKPRETILSREMAFARKINGKFNSVEEMWGALHIELDEVLDHIRDKTYDTSAAHYEMIQAAGILLRYVDEHGDKAEIAKRQGERHEKN